MVGLVIVSRSRALAEAACTLARGTGVSALPVDFAGGAGWNRREPGADATDIMEALMRVDSGDGVVVLTDSGDAAVAARLAEQLLGSDVPGIRLCPAPLVEGAVAAAALLASGADADAICAEAGNALAGKLREVDGDFDSAAPAAPGAEASADPVPSGALRIRFRVTDPAGMHLRPAAKLVETLAPFAVHARIRNYDADGAFFSASGVNRVSLADIGSGDTAEVALWGDRAEEALAALRTLVADVYHSRECDPDKADTAVFVRAGEDAADAPGRTLLSLAPGVAAGTLYIHRQDREQLPPLPVADPEYEISRLEAALTRVRAALGARRERLAAHNAGEAGLMTALLLMLDDADLLDQARGDIRRQSRDAASCYQARMLELAGRYRKSGNALLRERAADAAGVCDQVLDALQGKSSLDLESVSEVILWTEEATPDLLARWAPGQLRGVLTRSGAPTSHAAILARAMGIPAVAGYAPPREATTGLAVVMDANRDGAEIVVAPGEDVLRDFAARRDAWLAETAEDRANCPGPAVTADGRAVAVLANIGDAASAAQALENGAEGVGLLRTEFLFLDRARPPEEPEQVESLAAIFDILGAMPVTVRTVDAGGDRRFAGFGGGAAARSLLGMRGVRAYRGNPDLFKTQLRAILRAGFGRNIDIMFPMITVEEEVDFCRAMLEECHAELASASLPHLWPVKTGIMVETPAAALRAEALARKVDFFSIGTNDLAQYVMCAERGLAELAYLSGSVRPAVMEAVALVAKAAAANGIPVSVCGETAADPAAAPELLRLGIRRLSMNPAAIGRMKKTIRSGVCG